MMRARPAVHAIALLALLAASRTAGAAERLDPTLTVVLGGGLSAGYADFRLVETSQNQAWCVLAARQMGTYISVPTLRDPGQAGIVNSYQPLRGLVPLVPQSGERALPFPFFALNLSVPFLRVGDSLRLRPQPRYDRIKLIASIEGDLRQTFVNTILGGPLLTLQPPVLRSQAEYAEMLNPTLAFVQLGFEDVSEAAVGNDAARITAVASFAGDYTQLLGRLLATDASVVVMTVPDPLETAYFTSLDEAARDYGFTVADLGARFHLSPGDVITLGGMVEIADALRGRRRGDALPAGSVVSASVAAAIRAAVAGYNGAIRSAVQGKRAKLFDLAAFLHDVRANGHAGAYGGGFYSEDGLYPSPVGQALLANAVLQFLNAQYGAGYAPVAVPGVAP